MGSLSLSASGPSADRKRTVIPGTGENARKPRPPGSRARSPPESRRQRRLPDPGRAHSHVTSDPRASHLSAPPSPRVLGSLLSAHRIITDSKQPFGDMAVEDYDNELLHMARDLAVRLLPAFENTRTGIPYPRVGRAPPFPPACTGSLWGGRSGRGQG